MELNFDKEIDAILRRARDSETAFTAVNSPSHLDADEITAFAENALPAKTRERYTAHLADCDRCRKILSNLILLSSEAVEVETASSDVKTAVVRETEIPWYRRIFAMPNLAYTMGALVLVFAGLIASMVLLNSDGFRSGEISQMSESVSNANRSAPSEAGTGFSSNSANTNTSLAANTSANTANAPVYATNTATMGNTNTVILAEPNATVAAIPPATKPEFLTDGVKNSDTQDVTVTQDKANTGEIDTKVAKEENKAQTELAKKR